MKGIFFKIILVICLSFNLIGAYSEPEELKEDSSYRTLDELKQELKEERKRIDEQRLEEIRLKELEKQEKAKEEGGEIKEDKSEEKKEDKKEQPKQDENIPSLIVRLRGKHSAKYLCSYSFLVENENTESALEKNNIDDYTVLLKKPSLKVRVGEVINFEFSEEPKNITAFIWGDEIEELPIKRGTIKVPNVDKKIIVGVEGQYENGKILYAVVLDVRG